MPPFYTWSLLLTLPMDCQGGFGALVVRHTFGASPPSPIQKKNPLDLIHAADIKMTSLQLVKLPRKPEDVKSETQ